jgi:hypothetical protein
MRTKDTLLGPASAMAVRSRSMSMFPLKGNVLSVLSAKEEGVITRVFHRLETFAGGRQPRFLHNAHFVHFDRDFGSVG